MPRQRLVNELQNYFRQIKTLFPHYGKDEKRILQDLATGIDGYIASNPNAESNEIISHFGKPKNIIQGYLDHVDIDYLLTQIRRTKLIKTCAAIIVVLLLIAILIFAVFQQMHFQEAQQAYVDREEITIEDYQGENQ